MSKKIGAVIVGLIVILAGVGYAASAMGFNLDFSSLLFEGWWTVFIIVPGVLRLFRKDSNKVFAIALIVVGVGLLLSQLIHFELWSWLVPVIIVAVGVSIVVSAFTGSKNGENEKDNDK